MAASVSLREQAMEDLKSYPRLSARMAQWHRELTPEELAEHEDYQRGALIIQGVRRLREKFDDRHNYILEVYFWHEQDAEDTASLMGITAQAVEWVARRIVTRARQEFAAVGLSPYAEAAAED